MSDPKVIQIIQDYIREHGNTYTREAITRQLQEAGYEINEIEEARRGLNQNRVKPATPSPNLTLYLLLMLAIPGCMLLLNDAGGGRTVFTQYAGPINILFILAEAGLLIGSPALARRGWGTASIVALFFAVNFILFVIVLGTCTSSTVRYVN